MGLDKKAEKIVIYIRWWYILGVTVLETGDNVVEVYQLGVMHS